MPGGSRRGGHAETLASVRRVVDKSERKSRFEREGSERQEARALSREESNHDPEIQEVTTPELCPISLSWTWFALIDLFTVMYSISLVYHFPKGRHDKRRRLFKIGFLSDVGSAGQPVGCLFSGSMRRRDSGGLKRNSPSTGYWFMFSVDAREDSCGRALTLNSH